MIGWADPVGVLCELLEAGDGSLEARALRERFDAEIEFLSNIGAVTAADATRSRAHNDRRSPAEACAAAPLQAARY
jgi:hypothetical protein